MTTLDDFYVYEHWRPDKGVCFYVGKGRCRRAWDTKGMRNRHHQAIVAKLSAQRLAVEVRIIATGLSSKDACALEVKTIAAYPHGALTNMTPGGDGLTNPSEEIRKRISETKKTAYAAMSPDERYKFFSHARSRAPISAATRAKLSAAGTGRVHTTEARAKISAARKFAGIPEHVRKANIAALTGKKRPPFRPSTIIKMRSASIQREAIKRQRLFAERAPLWMEWGA